MTLEVFQGETVKVTLLNYLEWCIQSEKIKLLRDINFLEVIVVSVYQTLYSLGYLEVVAVDVYQSLYSVVLNVLKNRSFKGMLDPVAFNRRFTLYTPQPAD